MEVLGGVVDTGKIETLDALLMPRSGWIKVTIAACLLIGLALRLWELQRTPGLWVDEAFNGTDALQALRTGHLAAFYPSNNGREGLFINLQAGSIWLFRDILHLSAWPEPWMLRAVSAVFGSLTLISFYAFSRRLVGHREALLALFFLSTACWHVLFSRIGFRAIAAPFFLSLGLFLLLAALAAIRQRPRNVLLFSALAGVAFGLGFQTYIAFRPMPVLALVILLFATRSEPLAGRAAAALLFVAGFLASALPLLRYYAAHPAAFMGRANQVAVWSAPSPLRAMSWNIVKTAQMCFVFGDFSWRHNVPRSPELSSIVGLCVIAGFLRLAADLLKPGFRRNRAALLIGLLVASSLPVILSGENVPHALRGLQMLVPLMVLAGLGGMLIYRFMVRRRGFRIARVLAVSLLSASLVGDVAKYFGTWITAPQLAGVFSVRVVQAGYRLRTLSPEVPKVVVVSGNPLVEGQPAMFVADVATPRQQSRLRVQFTNDAAARRTPGAVVLETANPSSR